MGDKVFDKVIFRMGIALIWLYPSLLVAQTNGLATLEEVLAAKQDLWGLAAMRQPNGPSHEFFAKLLLPLRYVNAEFRDYPVVLSAPGGMQKVRLVSNGSAINARANLKTWKETGVSVSFRVGEDNEVFGKDPARLKGPAYEGGYLPVVQTSYEHSAVVYQEEAFAGVAPPASDAGVVFVRFRITGGNAGQISARLEGGPFVVTEGLVKDTNGAVFVSAGEGWKWDAAGANLVAPLLPGESAVLVVASAPGLDQSLSRPTGSAATKQYEGQRELCLKRWQGLLDEGTHVVTPETLVNDAWRSLVVGSFSLLKSNAMNYSAGNQYERLYQAECGDAAKSLLLWGHPRESLAMLARLFDYTRDGLEFHNAGFKLQAFAHWYWITRDAEAVRSLRPKWQAELDRIVNGREKESGLFPKERYCGDIATRVHSLNPNASCWRGMRDFSAVLADIGEKQAGKYMAIAAEFRLAISNAVARSEDRSTSPPFVPIMLFGEEKAYDRLTSSMVGSYWNLLAPYVIGSGIFGPGSERERWMLDYLQEHGGICMGMIRFHQHSGLFANEDALDDLYGLRYTIKLLELDEVDRALVSFYGKLAQGMTRGTFIGAEGTGLRALDEFGRPMYLPPNSSANALFLWTLRYLLVQDWDRDDDGKPETLRLGFATPKSWLEDGKRIKVEGAPTAFGPVSYELESRLAKGEVVATLALPERNPASKTWLRVRVPDSWRVISAVADGQTMKVDDRGTADISVLKGKATVRFKAQKQ